jgi:hypothetical protein
MDEIVKIAHDGMYNVESPPSILTMKEETHFLHHRLPLATGEKILTLLPKSAELEIWSKRAALFISRPGFAYRPHKDGLNMRFGINYPVVIEDDKCITRWFSDDIAIGKEIDYLGGRSREVVDYDSENHKPIHSTVMKIGYPVLFNTDIFHSWDNSNSENVRAILTLRTLNEKIDFQKAKSILFDK